VISLQEGFRRVALALLSRLADRFRRWQDRFLHDAPAHGQETVRQTGASDERLNPIWLAPESFIKDVPLADRLDDLLVFGLASGRLTDEEVELVEAAFVNEQRGRHAVDGHWDEEYRRWQAEIAAQQAGRKPEPTRSVQPFTVLAAKPAAHEPRHLHLLVNRIPILEELRFRVAEGVAVAQKDGYVVHFACDLPGLFVEGHTNERWKVTLEGGSTRAVLGRGGGGADVANRAWPELAAVDVVLSTNRYDYESGRTSGQYPGAITGRLADRLYGRFPSLAGEQQRAIADQAGRIERQGLDVAQRQRERRTSAMSSPRPASPSPATAPMAPARRPLTP
jgi:hypothetical protein